MKKLKLKIYTIIFVLLSSFTFLIFITSTTRNYLEKKKVISDILLSIPRINERPLNRPPDNARQIYLDFTIYTIILDENGNYQEIINNTNDELDEDYIKNIATNIINNHKENIYIGNLYIDKYAYAFTKESNLILMDNTKIKTTLVNRLISNILIFILCELIIIIITHLITKWIITPVKKSFEKQKIFVADASHELKTPLSVIIASSDAYISDKNEKWVYNIKSEAERMIKLVKELLDLAKTEKEQDIVMKENNLSEIIESSILTFESLFYEKEIELQYHIDDNIILPCNSDLIIELMSILIDNAIKHCPLKGKTIVNLITKNKQIILEVKNTGIPIKKEDEERVFERFYKVDTSRNRNSNNYGLGLSIAKNIVEKHKGQISCHSLNGYTIFKIIWNK